MTTTTAEPRLGSTLYAHTNEWRAGRYTLEELLTRVADLDLGPGLEVVGFQSFRGFPRLDAEYIRSFRGLVDRLGLVPSCLASNIDVALRSDRFLTTDESVDYLTAQLEVAQALGYPVMRIQIGATPEVIEKITPLAERARIRLGMELHAPEGPATPQILAVRDCYARIGSEYLGFIPDFSATMRRIPPSMLAQFEREGLPSELTGVLESSWAGDGLPHLRFDKFAEQARAAGAAEQAINSTRLAFTMFGHEDPQGWREILPQVVHVHGKFYEIDEAGEEPSIPYAEILGILREGGYTGFISSEWEGHAWADMDDADSFDLVRRHQQMCRRMLSQPAPEPLAPGHDRGAPADGDRRAR